MTDLTRQQVKDKITEMQSVLTDLSTFVDSFVSLDNDRAELEAFKKQMSALGIKGLPNEFIRRAVVNDVSGVFQD